MGLAASQARFLGLTARKSNVEFQGQQINQERTALANEVMGLYQRYNELSVPVPPSVSDYTKTTYTLDSTYEKYQISKFSKITSGEYEGYYNVTLTYNQENAKAYMYAAKNTSAHVEKTGDDYDKVSFQIGTTTYYYDKNDEDNSTITKIPDGSDYTKYPGLSVIMKSMGVTDGEYYMFKMGDNYYYTSKTELDDTAFDESGNYFGTYSYHYQGTYTKEQTVTGIASLSQTKDGRLSSINFVQCADDPELVGQEYSITVGSTEDEEAYEDAMNEYYYKKQKYENDVEKINKETEKLQAQDRTLEIKLAQLDTEQNALSTEMDSVSKVIEDTIESVFKTFQ